MYMKLSTTTKNANEMLKEKGVAIHFDTSHTQRTKTEQYARILNEKNGSKRKYNESIIPVFYRRDHFHVNSKPNILSIPNCNIQCEI